MTVASDSCQCLFIWHDGTPTEAGTAVTAATIEVQADTSIDLTINGSVDTRLGAADGVIVHTTYGTWGLIANHINAVQGRHCTLRDAHWDGLPDGMNALTETTCLNVAVGVSTDDSDDFQMGLGIANYKAGTSMEAVQACLYFYTGQITSTNGTPLCQLYDCDDQAGTEQLVRQWAISSATEHAYPADGPFTVPTYVAPPGHRILLLFEGTDNLTGGRANIIGGLRQIA